MSVWILFAYVRGLKKSAWAQSRGWNISLEMISDLVIGIYEQFSIGFLSERQLQSASSLAHLPLTRLFVHLRRRRRRRGRHNIGATWPLSARIAINNLFHLIESMLSTNLDVFMTVPTKRFFPYKHSSRNPRLVTAETPARRGSEREEGRQTSQRRSYSCDGLKNFPSQCCDEVGVDSWGLWMSLLKR